MRLQPNGFENALCDALLLIAAKPGEHWQRYYFSRHSFRDREIALLEAQVAIGILQVKSNRIMYSRSDLRLREIFLQLCAIFNADHVQVVYSFGPRWLKREDQ